MPPSFFLHRHDLDDFILIHTMGKVGSMSVLRSFQNVNIYCRHVHWASAATEAFFDRFEQISPTGTSHWNYYLQSRLNMRRLRAALADRDYASLIKVVTAIRAPVDQILSHYFQAMPVWEAALQSRKLDLNVTNLRALMSESVAFHLAKPDRTLAELTQELDAGNSEHIMFCWLVHNYVHWFEEQLLPFFAVDILGGRFRDGFQIAGNALILKFEDLSNHGERVLAAYAKRPRFKLVHENAGTRNAHGELYREMTSATRFPAAFVDRLCDGPYVRHFYGDDERDAMRRRWIA
jgi:hypothetical protein